MEGALAAYERADRSGHGGAASNRGLLLEEQVTWPARRLPTGGRMSAASRSGR